MDKKERPKKLRSCTYISIGEGFRYKGLRCCERNILIKKIYTKSARRYGARSSSSFSPIFSSLNIYLRIPCFFLSASPQGMIVRYMCVVDIKRYNEAKRTEERIDERMDGWISTSWVASETFLHAGI